MCTASLAPPRRAIIVKAVLMSAILLVFALSTFSFPAYALSFEDPKDWGFMSPKSGRLPANGCRRGLVLVQARRHH